MRHYISKFPPFPPSPPKKSESWSQVRVTRGNIEEFLFSFHLIGGYVAFKLELTELKSIKVGETFQCEVSVSQYHLSVQVLCHYIYYEDLRG